MPLDESRKASIRAALQSYRETVFTQSTSLLSILVKRINGQVPPGNSDPEAIQRARLQIISNYFLGYMCHDKTIQDLISSPQDLLSLTPDSPFTKRFCLDGVLHSTAHLDEADKAWTRLRQDLLQSKCPSSSQDPKKALEYPTDTPHDLEYLTTLIPSITGPHISHDISRSITFFPPDQGFYQLFTPFRTTHTPEAPIEEMEYKPREPFEHAFEGWALTVAIQTGEPFPDWTPSGIFAVYCSDPSNGKGWQWRYGINEKYYSTELYDTVEEFLEFYARFEKEEAEGDVREMVVMLDL